MTSSAINVGSRVMGAALQAVLLILLARTSPLDAFGQFGIAIAAGAIAVGILSFGIPTAALRNAREPGYARFASRASLVIGLLVAIGTTLAGTLVVGAVSIPVVAGALFMASDATNNVLQSITFGREDLRRANIIMVARRLIPLCGLLIGIAFATEAETSLYISVGLGSIASAAACMLAVGREKFSIRIDVRAEISRARSYWHTNIWSMAQQSDVMIVGGMMGAPSAAAFTAAFRLASPVHIFTSLLVARLIPAASRSGPDHSLTGRLMKLAVVYASLLLLGSPLLAVMAIWILGPAFTGFWAVFTILFANSAFSVVNQTLSAWIFGRDRMIHWVPRATAASLVIGLSIVFFGAFNNNLVIAAAGTAAIQICLLCAVVAIALHLRRKK